jgi:glucose/arabinose dehydrogenase
MQHLARTRRRSIVLAVLVIIGLVVAACGADQASTATPTPSSQLIDIGEGLQGPEGTTATVEATGLQNVAALAFDGQGRLWAATAAFSDDGTDAVYLVTGNDADEQRVVADIHTPLGLLWIDDTLYVASAERVDAFSDFDGTRFTASRQVLDLPDDVGEVNGLARAPDGRLVLGISAPCDSCDPTSELSGAVVSFLPDGSDLQLVARNIRAPVGLTYYPGTDDLFVTMNHQDELGVATPGDWLALVEDGQDWRFPGCYGQGGTACAGVPSPVAELDAHAAVSGVAMVTGSLGANVGTAALVAEWAEGKVLRVTLEPNGDGYASVVGPFVTGLEQPVPVVTAPDGSVLIGDWGTGAVYRIALASTS